MTTQITISVSLEIVIRLFFCTFVIFPFLIYNGIVRRALYEKQALYVFRHEQHRTLLRCLVEFKNDLVRQGRTADIVDEVILKVMNAPVKKLRV